MPENILRTPSFEVYKRFVFTSSRKKLYFFLNKYFRNSGVFRNGFLGDVNKRIN